MKSEQKPSRLSKTILTTLRENSLNAFENIMLDTDKLDEKSIGYLEDTFRTSLLPEFSKKPKENWFRIAVNVNKKPLHSLDMPDYS